MSLKRIFFLIFTILLVSVTGGCRHHEKILTDEEIFDRELKNIISQQSSIRRETILQTLQNEYSQALTLSSFNELELMLENYELSETEKNNALLNYFGHALLYMQIMLFPDEREKILSAYIHDTLLYELGSIFVHLTVSRHFISQAVQITQSESNQQLQNQWNESAENRKIEYDTLRINDLNAADNIPDLSYPLKDVPAINSLENFRQLKKNAPAMRLAAKNIYSKLQEQHKESFPLFLLKLLYKSPSVINQFYSNDTDLKKGFCDLLSELVLLYRSEQLFNNMQNALNMRSDMQKMLSSATPVTVQMLDGCAKSELAYQLANLKMLAFIGISPFGKIPAETEKIELTAPAKLTALKLLFNDIAKTIR